MKNENAFLSEMQEYNNHLAWHHLPLELCPSFEEWKAAKQKRLDDEAHARQIEVQKRACNLYILNN